MKSTELNPKKYWQKRIKGQNDITASGHRSLSPQYNKWLYKRRVEALVDILQQFSINTTKISILDVGCGNGFFTAFWEKNETKKYFGIDISSRATKKLSKDYPSFSFQKADITLPEPLPHQKTFNLITIFDVLYHIIDDNEFKVALNNLNEMLSPNGYILIFDQLAAKQISLKNHVIYRKRAHFHKALHDAGLQVVKTEKLFAFLAPPVYGNTLIDTSIAGLYKSTGIVMNIIPPLGHLAGKLNYSLDKFLLSKNFSPPNHELFVIRKK